MRRLRIHCFKYQSLEKQLHARAADRNAQPTSFAIPSLFDQQILSQPWRVRIVYKSQRTALPNSSPTTANSRKKTTTNQSKQQNNNIMTSLRRSLIIRLSGQFSPVSSSPASQRIIDDDAASIRSVLPSYSMARYDRQIPVRPISPPPTYYTVDEPTTPTSLVFTNDEPRTPTSPSFPPAPRSPRLAPNGDIDKRAAVEELISRLHETITNPKAWRLHPAGGHSFFWALRCAAGTADILCEKMDEIREKTIDGHGWTVHKFCFAFRGQQLGDLACRPVKTAQYGTEADPLKEDYIVIQLYSRH